MAAIASPFSAWSGWAANERGGSPFSFVFTGPVTAVLWLLAALFVMKVWSSVWVAMAAAVISVVDVVGVFASIYLAYGSSRDWSEHLTRTDALLISLGTLTTAGTGGISPTSQAARGWLAAQMAVDIVATIVIFGVFAARVADRRGR